jgi:hypothetical protein
VVVLALVAATSFAVGTGRVAVASPVVVDTSSSLSETASAPFTFDTRGFENLPLNTSISVTFFDDDMGSQHTFTILNASGVQLPDPSTYSNGALDDLLARYGTLDNVTATSNSYAPASVITEVAAPSWYEFFCTVSGHFQAGMYGFVAFGEALPPNVSLGSASPGPGLAVFIIIGTIVSLTVLAIVLGFVVGRREGAVHEMPPERLGYPEPPASDASHPERPPPPLSP